MGNNETDEIPITPEEIWQRRQELRRAARNVIVQVHRRQRMKEAQRMRLALRTRLEQRPVETTNEEDDEIMELTETKSEADILEVTEYNDVDDTLTQQYGLSRV